MSLALDWPGRRSVAVAVEELGCSSWTCVLWEVGFRILLLEQIPLVEVRHQRRLWRELCREVWLVIEY